MTDDRMVARRQRQEHRNQRQVHCHSPMLFCCRSNLHTSACLIFLQPTQPSSPSSSPSTCSSPASASEAGGVGTGNFALPCSGRTTRLSAIAVDSFCSTRPDLKIRIQGGFSRFCVEQASQSPLPWPRGRGGGQWRQSSRTIFVCHKHGPGGCQRHRRVKETAQASSWSWARCLYMNERTHITFRFPGGYFRWPVLVGVSKV